MKKIDVPTIGEILKEDFMDPYHISAYSLANAIGVPVSRIQDILHNRRAITVDTSIRLAKYFGLSNTYFIKLQYEIDTRKALNESKESFDKIIPFKFT